MSQQQPYMQPQVMVMPVPQTNGLGVFGFFVALIGLFIPTGIVSLLGLVLSLAAIGRAPRGFATMGVVLGLLGTVFWLVIMLFAVALGLVGLVIAGIGVGVCFMLVNPEVVETTTDMINVAIAAEDYKKHHNGLPESIDELDLSVAVLTDPWGGRYKFVLADVEHGFDVISGGPDGEFKTDDDVTLTGLDRFWEKAIEDFGEKMEEFGPKMEAMQGRPYEIGCKASCDDGAEGIDDHPLDYESEAMRELAEELEDIIEIEVEVEETPDEPAPPPAAEEDDA
ncbi:MAG: hypothetical protein SYC29_13160 [Planctomycetota bacterium]|nr:hypothetical protein [Planctomycetota bacterium]